MKTFNSPGRCPKMPHCNMQQQHNSETIRISQPAAKSVVTNEWQMLPWKRALPAQPSMGVRKESWEKNFKRGKIKQFNGDVIITAIVRCS